MTLPAPICYVDADGFSDTIHVVLDWNKTVAAAGSTMVTTGHAEFTYTRASLGDTFHRTSLLVALIPTPGDAEFLPLQAGIGKAPGWMVFFGIQPDQTNAITYTTTYSDGSPTSTSYGDASCALFLTCAQTAPGKQVNDDFFVTITPGIRTLVARVVNAAYTVVLLQAGIPADPSDPSSEAVNPVYRVTVPTGAINFVGGDLVIFYNGARQTPGADDPRVGNIYDLGNLLGSFGTVAPRSPWVYDILMANFGDVLAAGTFSYYTAAPADSTIVFNGITQTIADPFPVAGQSFTFTDPDSGLTAVVNL